MIKKCFADTDKICAYWPRSRAFRLKGMGRFAII